MRQKTKKVKAVKTAKAITISPDTYRELKGACRHFEGRYSMGELVDMLVAMDLWRLVERMDG